MGFDPTSITAARRQQLLDIFRHSRRYTIMKTVSKRNGLLKIEL